MPDHDDGIGRRCASLWRSRYGINGVECGRGPSMLKMKSWSTARIIFAESCARKR